MGVLVNYTTRYCADVPSLKPQGQLLDTHCASCEPFRRVFCEWERDSMTKIKCQHYAST